MALERSDVSGSGGRGKGRRQLVEMRGLGLRVDCVLEPPDSSESVGPGGCLGIGSPLVI